MRRQKRRVTAFGVGVAVLLACYSTMVGLIVGRTGRVPAAQAALVRTNSSAGAYRQAQADGYRAGWRPGYRLGWARGTALGRNDGRRAGLAAARARAAKRAAAGDTASRTLAVAVTPVSRKAIKTTNKCVQVGGGLCEVLGPGATGKPCPPQSVPNAVGGLTCVPRLLIDAYQAAAAPGASPPGR